MVLWVAFLRGINVGGHVVKNAELERIFDSLGLDGVHALRQSGNVMFSCESGEAPDLAKSIHDRLSAELGFDVPSFLRTREALEQMAGSEPFRGVGEGASRMVTFLDHAITGFPLPLPSTIPGSTAIVLSTNGTEVFSITHGGGEGGLPNPYIESIIGRKATTRNMRVVMEILACR